MRFALLLIFPMQIAATSANAQVMPGTQDKETLRIYADALAADAYCPGMRINSPQLQAYLASRGFADRNIRDAYPAFFDKSSSLLMQGVKEEIDFYCRFFFDELGDVGVHPHILVRR